MHNTRGGADRPRRRTSTKVHSVSRSCSPLHATARLCRSWQLAICASPGDSCKRFRERTQVFRRATDETRVHARMRPQRRSCVICTRKCTAPPVMEKHDASASVRNPTPILVYMHGARFFRSTFINLPHNHDACVYLEYVIRCSMHISAYLPQLRRTQKTRHLPVRRLPASRTRGKWSLLTWEISCGTGPTLLISPTRSVQVAWE